MKRVVVTGLGVISPLGIGKTSFWENLLAGKSGIGPINALDPGGFDCRIAGQVPPYKIGDYVPKTYRKATKLMARDIELAVVAADEAFKDAGLLSKAHTDSPGFDGFRFGCNIGAGLISAELDELTRAMNMARSEASPNRLDLKKWGSIGLNELTPLWLLKYLPNMLACHVTIIHGLMGPSNTITCSDSSSHLAIGEAFRTIQRGKAERVICGGAESKLNPMGLMRQSLLGRLCTSSNDNPTGAVRPFDVQASGSVIGEGGGLLILEELEHAQKRGATIYAELVGFGASQDVHAVTEPDPRGTSYSKALVKALKDADVSPESIDVLVPHGLGIADFDAAELQGLKKALGDHLSKPAFCPIKAQTGNLSAGCGVDVATAVMALHTQQAPPAVNTLKPLGGQRLNIAPSARSIQADVAVTLAYSLGGQNAALVFRRMSG